MARERSDGYGGFYAFRDRPAFDSFVARERFEALGSHSEIDELTASEFEIDQRPDRPHARAGSGTQRKEP